jgi:hypothetical protein
MMAAMVAELGLMALMVYIDVLILKKL